MSTSTISDKNNKKLKTPITVLAIISLIITFVSSIFSCFSSDFLSLLYILPPLLLALYITGFQNKGCLFLIIISAANAILNIVSIINLIPFTDIYIEVYLIDNIGGVIFFSALILLAIKLMKESKQECTKLKIPVCILSAAALVIKTIYLILSAFISTSNLINFTVLNIYTLLPQLFLFLYVCKITNKERLLLLIISSVYTPFSLLATFTNYTYINRHDKIDLYHWGQLILNIGSAIFYIALILLAINIKKEKAMVKDLTPEEELKLLAEKLEIGTITTEEYSILRAEIISKL